MTRAAERNATTEAEPMPDLSQDDQWDHIAGETPDGATQKALNLAHRATEKFPELTGRYKGFAGKAVIVSGALMALAGVAVARRMRRGQNEEQILEQITSEEIERAATTQSRHTRWWRMIGRIARRRRNSEKQGSSS